MIGAVEVGEVFLSEHGSAGAQEEFKGRCLLRIVQVILLRNYGFEEHDGSTSLQCVLFPSPWEIHPH